MTTNANTETVTVENDVAQVIQDTIFWFESRIEALNDIANSEYLISLNNRDGDSVELDEDESRVFKSAIKTAISLIGKIPLSLDRPVTSFDLDKDVDD